MHGLPRTLGRYELLSTLGQGGMASVMRAHDPVLRRDVAIKIVDTTGLADDDRRQLRYLFHREARATAALQHPNIVEIYDYSGADAEPLYIACEFLAGPTLRAVLDLRTRISSDAVAALGYELASALAAAHAQNIIHRDVKPENVFWLDNGRVVLCDFGIAKALEHNRLGQTVVWQHTRLYGSPAYMAPELLDGAAPSPQSDLFSLGALLFECLSGTPAFSGDTVEAILAAVTARQRPILPLALKTPAALSALVYALIQPEPALRPKSAAAVRDELRRILDDLEVTDPRVRLMSQGDDSRWLRPTAPEPPDDDEEDDRSSLTRAAEEAASGSSVAVGWLLVVSLALAIAVYFLIDMFRMGGANGVETTLPTTTVSPEKTVMVELQLPGPANLTVDGTPVGLVSASAHIPLLPGQHRLVVTVGDDKLEKEITVISGTSPRFVISRPGLGK